MQVFADDVTYNKMHAETYGILLGPPDSPGVGIKSAISITPMAQMCLYVVHVWEETGVPGENPRAWTGDHVPYHTRYLVT